MARPHRANRNHAQAELQCWACPTRQGAEWRMLDDSDMGRIDQSKITRRYQRGQLLYAQRQPAAGVFCLAAGTVAVTKAEGEVGRIFLRLASAGETLGYENCLGGVCRTSAQALHPTTACLVGLSTLQPLLRRRPSLCERFQESVAGRLDDTEAAMLRLASLPVRVRLARLLLELSQRYGEDAEPKGLLTMTPPLTRRDMSELLCTRPETLTRAMQAMEQDGLLSHHGHAIHIPRVEALQAEATAV